MCLGSVQAIYRWENGECFPTMDNFFALLELYEVNPFEVLVKRKDKSFECMSLEFPFVIEYCGIRGNIDYIYCPC